MIFDTIINFRNLNLPEKDAQEIEDEGGRDLFENLLVQSLNKIHPQGIDGKTSRILFRILDKLDKSNHSRIDLEEAELDLIYQAFCSPSAKFLAGQVRAVSQYQEKIELLKGKDS